MEIFNPDEFQNWLPSKLFEKEGELFLEWIYLWDVHFAEPFFDETLTKCRLKNSMNGAEKKGKRVTSIEILSEIANYIDSVEPELFIFHTSRCGSTLTTQILSMNSQNIVFPEYAIVDSILRAQINGNSFSIEKRKEWLRNLIKIMGQKRFPDEKRLILKLDSWHFHFHSFIRELYPEVPFAILYREPNAILRSNQKQWGMQFISEIIPASIFNIQIPTLSPFSINDYANMVLQSMYSSILKIAVSDKNIILLDYCNGMVENLIRLIEILNIDPSFMNQKEVYERLKFHSKNPNDIFMEAEVKPQHFASDETLRSYIQLKSYSELGGMI
jgi:hypothetical protein